MATITKTYTENQGYTSGRATWTLVFTGTDVSSNKTGQFIIPTPIMTAKYVSSSRGRGEVFVGCALEQLRSGREEYMYSRNMGAMTSGQAYTISKDLSYLSAKPVSDFFTSSNPTTREVNIPLYIFYLQVVSETSDQRYQSYYSNLSEQSLGTILKAKIDEPPTFTASNLSKDTSVYVAGVTNVSVTVSNATAYYGGNISSAKLTVGTQEATISGNGTISMALQNAGTFTPAVTVTDSRGQTTTQNLEPITVLQYENPTVSFDVFRTDDTGMRDDEGHNGLVTATFTYMDAVSSLAEPEVQINGYDISQTIGASITWYTALTQSGAVDTTTEIDDWSDIASGATVYGLLDGNYDVTGNFGEGESYLIGLIAKDSRNKTSALITQTLPTAFYTIDFQAGGKEIAFGAPANDDLTAHANGLFKSKMDAYFVGEETLIEKPYFSLDTTASSGVDHDLYSAITALGWQSDVIV